MRSTLFTKSRVGTCRRCSARIRIRVCGWTPSTAESTSDGAVQHPEDPLDLGDEVGVARGVDDVDRGALERERHDRGLDGDAAAALERQAVGAGGAEIDRPRHVDDSCQVQEPLGQRGLTGVDVGEDPQVQRAMRRTCAHA